MPSFLPSSAVSVKEHVKPLLTIAEVQQKNKINKKRAQSVEYREASEKNVTQVITTI